MSFCMLIPAHILIQYVPHFINLINKDHDRACTLKNLFPCAWVTINFRFGIIQWAGFWKCLQSVRVKVNSDYKELGGNLQKFVTVFTKRICSLYIIQMFSFENSSFMSDSKLAIICSSSRLFLYWMQIIHILCPPTSYILSSSSTLFINLMQIRHLYVTNMLYHM